MYWIAFNAMYGRVNDRNDGRTSAATPTKSGGSSGGFAAWMLGRPAPGSDRGPAQRRARAAQVQVSVRGILARRLHFEGQARPRGRDEHRRGGAENREYRVVRHYAALGADSGATESDVPRLFDQPRQPQQGDL